MVKPIDLPDHQMILSRSIDGPDPIRDRVLCARLELPLDFRWESLARVVLDAAEGDFWSRLASNRRRTEWLMGRMAAKDAVRMYALRHRGLALSPGDIGVAADAHGRPVPGGATLERLGLQLSLSLAHTDGIAVAAVCEPGRGVGIDVERLSRRRGAIEEAAFSAGERALLGPTGTGRDERVLRLWCAKEAVGKALGRGLMGSPLNLEARSSDANLDTVSVALAGRLAREFPDLVGSAIMAFTRRDGDVVVAIALYEAPHA
jgi:phosphopantetheinyl transferase